MNKNKQTQISGGGATIYTNKWFTLVELIVVITILAILSTIWFVSYSWYLAWVRDINRISQLKAIWDALHLYSTNKNLPIPDDKVDVVSDWTDNIIAYQWDIWANVIDTIWYTSEWKDPKDWTYFSYYLTKNKKYFQLMAHLEEDPNSTALTLPLLNSTNAEINYSKRFPAVEWDKLWILTWTWNTPIHRIDSIISSWSLDIADTWTWVFKSYLKTDESISWSWTTFKELINISKKWGKGYSIINWNKFQFQAQALLMEQSNFINWYAHVTLDPIWTVSEYYIQESTWLKWEYNTTVTSLNWSSAFTYCADKWSSWRLPTKGELIWVLDNTLTNTYESNLPSIMNNQYWSSTPDTTSGIHIFVLFGKNYDYSWDYDSYSYGVLCIHN